MYRKGSGSQNYHSKVRVVCYTAFPDEQLAGKSKFHLALYFSRFGQQAFLLPLQDWRT
jgi:transcriptional regulator of aromatic amino acid metabolism